jgi:hypothetical protein
MKKLTNAQREMILRLTPTTPQEEIALISDCCVSTVRRLQKIAGMKQPRRFEFPAEIQAKIKELAGQEFGYRRIASALALQEKPVRAFMRANGLAQKVGGPRLPKKKREALEKSIRRRENFLCKIAVAHHVGLETARRYKKRILGDAPLLSTWPPLTSKFPQTDASEFVPTVEEMFLELAKKCLDEVAEKYLRQGRYSPEEILAAKRILKADPTPVFDTFNDGLRRAVALLCANESGLVN